MAFSRKIISKILLQNEIPLTSIRKIDIGFRNEVYQINENYILKICKADESSFKKELLLYSFLRNKLPVPDVVFSDFSKKELKRPFAVYRKIPGANLYSRWHLFTDVRRREIVRQICAMLRSLNDISLADISKAVKFEKKINWHDKILSQIAGNLSKLKSAKILPPKLLLRVKTFVQKHHPALKQQKLGLVHYDIHFDNILVRGAEVIGILDFEDVDVMSIDYILDTIKRMVDHPKIYAASKYEKFVKKKDYAQLITWFREFYPELFDFDNLDKRLALYALEYDLGLLLKFPKSTSLKRRLLKTLALT
ncbi:aminoglycoside phosphotransferase family protein [Candidatus Woesearchaeota archaeon]|nr:aminoglycoside phosphotransferase family protein [Candidatus Woesearchaeota archaeon]